MYLVVQVDIAGTGQKNDLSRLKDLVFKACSEVVQVVQQKRRFFLWENITCYVKK
jgi:hypothetical protein